MVDTKIDEARGGMMAAVSSAMVALHKEQSGRGPTRARSNFAGNDVLVCVLDDMLLPAERTMVAMGDQQRVRDTRMYLRWPPPSSSSRPLRTSCTARSTRLPAPPTPTTTPCSRSSPSNPIPPWTATRADRHGTR